VHAGGAGFGDGLARVFDGGVPGACTGSESAAEGADSRRPRHRPPWRRARPLFFFRGRIDALRALSLFVL
jgi:hypothetical protein